MTTDELLELIELLRHTDSDLQHVEAKRAVHELPVNPRGDFVHPPLPEHVQRGGRSGRTRADRRPAILALLAEHGELSRAEIAAQLGLTDGNARKWLRILIAESTVEQTSSPRSKHQRYLLKNGAAPGSA